MLQGTQQSVCGYELKDTIGYGAHGKVKLGVNYLTGEVAAVKVVKTTGPGGQNFAALLAKEVKIHASVNHENIIKLLGAVDDESHVYIVLEYAAAGELFDRIEPDIGVEEELAHMYFQQLINGVEYLHTRGVCHRDLKPENLLVDADGNLKISDFGLATVFKAKGQRRMLKNPCGTPPYVAPEIHAMAYNGDEVDIWSAGVILFALVAGNTPWAEPTDHDVEYRAYLKEYPRPTFEPWDRVPAAVIELLTGILNPDPTRRYTIDMIRSNSWFRSENPLLTDGRCNNPEHLAERMMSQATMDVDLPPIAYSQPTDMRADNYSPNMEDASPEQRHVVSFSQPVGMAIDSNTQNASPEGTLSQARGGFIDFFRSERATRFYSYHDAASISHNLHSVLEGFLVPWKHHGQMTISFTTVDKRKCPLHGEVSIHAAQDGLHLVHFRKSKGDPMEFKRFYKSVRDALGEIVAT